MTTWYTSDTHFFHRNIIKYCNRPYSSVEEMNSSLIANHNSLVAPGDTVWHLGDFSFGGVGESQAILNQLNGVKHLIRGNHDEVGELLQGWASVSDYAEISVDGHKFILCHYAMRVWNKSHKGAWMLYGHSHGTLPDDPNLLSIDVGVDCHNYKPINTSTIAKIMKRKTWKPIDHHGKR